MIVVKASTLVTAVVTVYLLMTVSPFILLMLREVRKYQESGAWNLGRIGALCAGITLCYFPVFMALPSSYFYTRLFLIGCIFVSAIFLAVRTIQIVKKRRRLQGRS
ncbi:MAG: hypothetical protein ACJ74Q_14960 [Pyrinomonadaceae bacterium]